jgi:hypothetical protein
MSIYGAEQRIHFGALTSPCRVLDPSLADYFIVPVYSSLLIHAELFTNATSTANLKSGYNFLADAHEALLYLSPYYARNNGSDHIYTVSHDIGSCISPPYISSHSIFLQHFSHSLHNNDVVSYLENTTDVDLLNRVKSGLCYNSSKDVVIPPFIGERDGFALDNVINSRFTSHERRVDNLFYFRGTVHENPVYSKLTRQKLRDDGGKVALSQFSFDLLEDDQEYWSELTNSVYCLTPGGWVGWSPRTYQAIAAGCIPVFFLEEGEVLPFENFVDWKSFGVFLDKDGDFREQLDKVREEGERGVIERRKAIERNWRAFTYGRDPRRTEWEERTVVVGVVEYVEGRRRAVLESGGEGGVMSYLLRELEERKGIR